ncbi:MAG: hypothetical protein KGH49_03720 [Candidatus Micrarchaeota archaeon]|nr:hypothetical protein [Candidatus Micrarchaeota archaeon]
MKVFINKDKTTFVMSESGGKCPRASFARNSAKIRDDYHGQLKLVGKLFGKIAKL